MTTAFPEPHFVETNGIRMAVYEAGPKDGFPIVFCHGFPELAYSWRHQLPALGAAGFRAIAPDQRGYGATDRPEPVEDYDMEHLTGDLVGLLDHLKIEKAIFERLRAELHRLQAGCGFVGAARLAGAVAALRARPASPDALAELAEAAATLLAGR